MQLKYAIAPALALGLCAAWVQPCAAFFVAEEQTVDPQVRYFADSDKVSVRSYIGSYALTLRGDVSLNAQWNNERVVIPAVEAPAGSQQAIDAITTASRPISGNAYEDFVKVRNEFETGLKRGGVALDYYLSVESDYRGQQLATSYNRDFRNQQLNLSLGTSYGWDAIEPLADDDTNQPADTRTNLHWNAVATQVVSPTTLVRVGLEYNLVRGLQHNPYRNVYAGGGNQAERHPDRRQRRDAFLKINQYLTNRSSVKASYRLYNDDWGVQSHEISTKLSQYITQGLFARYRHRYYTQSAADFYSDNYTSSNGIDGYLTGDYRLSDLSSHLFGFSLDLDLFTLAADSPLLSRLGLWFNYERYFNSNNYTADLYSSGIKYRF